MTIRPNKRRFAIGFYVLTGWTPWGVDLAAGTPHLTKTRPNRWVACCGHVLSDDEVERWITEGLLAEAPATLAGASRVSAGPHLERWISDAWHALKARSWGA